MQVLVALGEQDTDPSGLIPPNGIEILGASSDHVILNAGTEQVAAGDEIIFQPNYSAFLRAFSSAYVTKVMVGADIPI